MNSDNSNNSDVDDNPDISQLRIVTCNHNDPEFSTNLVTNPSRESSGVNINTFSSSKIKPAKLIMPLLWFGEKRFEVLLDTGACVSLIKKSVQQFFKLQLDTNTKITINGIGGEPFQTLGTVTFSGKLFNQNLDDITFHVIDDDKLNVIAILGVDIMQQHKMTLNIFRQRLSFDLGGDQVIHVHYGYHNDINSSPITYVNIPAYVSNNVNILPKSTALVSFTHNIPQNGNSFLFEGHKCSRRLQSSSTISPALLYLPVNKRILVRNDTDKSFHIFKNEVIGHLTTTFEHDPKYTPSDFDISDTDAANTSTCIHTQSYAEVPNDSSPNAEISSVSNSAGTSPDVDQISCSMPNNIGVTDTSETVPVTSSHNSNSPHNLTLTNTQSTPITVNCIDKNVLNSESTDNKPLSSSSTCAADYKSQYSLNVSKSKFYVNNISPSTSSPQPNVDSTPFQWTQDTLQDQIKLGENLDPTQKKLILDLLVSKSQVLSTCDEDIGQLNIGQHRMKLSDCTPIYMRPRRFPDPVTQEIDKQVLELVSNDIIERSCSPYNSPIVPVRKPDGSLRLCIDYRKLNEVTIPDRFPMPNLLDEIYKLNGCKYFTSLDLTRGYYQLPMEEESKEYTAFSTAHGHWQFKRMPFGLRNAPSSFQRIMLDILQGFSRSSVIVYIDDILILSEDFETHCTLVEQVLTTLSEHGLKIKPKKCELFSDSVNYLGHTISSDGLTKPQKYLDKVKEYPKPTTVKKLQEFLGFANFQRKFAPNFSEIAQPLYAQITRNSKRTLQWTDLMEKAFYDLKDILARDIKVSFPNYSEGANMLELFVDASSKGAGACLGQIQEDCWRVIAFDSMTFSETQRNYSTIERELAAMRWGVKTFKAFLFGQEFILHTDHQPLTYLQNMKLVDQRLARTLSDLEGFRPILKYTPGPQNQAADALSRLATAPYPTPATAQDAAILPEGVRIIQRLEGGGDSLFVSLSVAYQDFLEENGRNDDLDAFKQFSPKDLREFLVEKLVKNPAKYGLSREKFKTRQLSLMKIPGQIPCQEIITVFSDAFSTHVYVHYGPTLPLVYAHSDSSNRVHLQCLAGIHYNPLHETKGYQIIDHEVHYTWSHPSIHSDFSDSSLDSELVNSTSNEDLRLTSCHHAHSSLGHTRIHVGDKVYCACLDSGAQISVVSESIIMDQQLVTEDISNSYIYGINNNEVKIVGVVDLKFGFDLSDTTYTFSCAVVPDNSVNVCCLFGVDFLSTIDCDLDFGNKRLLTKDGYLKLGVSGLNPTLNMLDTSSLVVNQLSYHYDRQQIDGILSDQGGSNFLQRLKYRIKNHLPVTEEFSIFSRSWKGLKISNNVLCHQKLPVVSNRFLLNLVLHTHVQMAHIGSFKLFELIKQHVYNPTLRKTVLDACTTCSECQRSKPTSKLIVPPMFKIKTSGPFELMAMDLVSLPPSHGYIGMLVVVDHFSKWLAVAPIRDKKAKTITNILETQIFPALLQVPSRVLTDNGPEFNSLEFNELMDNFQIQHIYTTAYKPSSNGAVERVNRTIIGFLRDLSSKSTNWFTHLQKAVIIYNQTVHTETKLSPTRFLLTKAHLSHKDVPIVSPETRLMWAQGHPQYEPFNVNQSVLKRREFPARLNIHKLEYKFDGPFNVIKVNPNRVTYELSCPDTGRIIKAHHTQLKLWKDPPAYILDHLERFPLTKVLDIDDPYTPPNRDELVSKPSVSESTDDGMPYVPMMYVPNPNTYGVPPLLSPIRNSMDQSFTPLFYEPDFSGFNLQVPMIPMTMNRHIPNFMEQMIPQNLPDMTVPMKYTPQNILTSTNLTSNNPTNHHLSNNINTTQGSSLGLSLIPSTSGNYRAIRSASVSVSSAPLATGHIPMSTYSTVINQLPISSRVLARPAATSNVAPLPTDIGDTPIVRPRLLFSTSTPVTSAAMTTGMRCPLFTPVNGSVFTNNEISDTTLNNPANTSHIPSVHSSPIINVPDVSQSISVSSPIMTQPSAATTVNNTPIVTVTSTSSNNVTNQSVPLNLNMNSESDSFIGFNPGLRVATTSAPAVTTSAPFRVFLDESSYENESYHYMHTYLDLKVFPTTHSQLVPTVIQNSLYSQSNINVPSTSGVNNNIESTEINVPEVSASSLDCPVTNNQSRESLDNSEQSSNFSISQYILELEAERSLSTVDDLVTSIQHSNHEQTLNTESLDQTCEAVLEEVSMLRKIFSELVQQARQETTILEPVFVDTRPHTRRRGSVRSLPNVMDYPLEHKPRDPRSKDTD